MTAVVGELGAAVDDWVEAHEAELVAARRHLHAHPYPTVCTQTVSHRLNMVAPVSSRTAKTVVARADMEEDTEVIRSTIHSNNSCACYSRPCALSASD